MSTISRSMHTADFSRVWGAQASRPQMRFAFQQFHVARGRQETCFTYSCPRRSRFPGSKCIRLLLLLRLPVIDSHCFAKYSSAC